MGAVIDVGQPYSKIRPNVARCDVGEERRFSTSNPERSCTARERRRQRE